MLTKDKTGLIVVDVQGKLARLVHDSSNMIANCETLIRGASILELPIICLEQNPEKLGPTVSELGFVLQQCPFVTKYTFDACENSEFINLLIDAKVDNWLLCGIEAHICVYQTAIGLLLRGYNVQLVTDCISSRKVNNKQLAIQKLIHRGAEISGVEMCLFELIKDCRASEFREILSLVR